MKDLQRFYMELASSLERIWTPGRDKRHAAILLRNQAIETPHCHFCGVDEEDVPGPGLYDSRYNPKARICKLCAYDIAAQFAAAHKTQGEGTEPQDPITERLTATTEIDYRKGIVVEELAIKDRDQR